MNTLTEQQVDNLILDACLKIIEEKGTTLNAFHRQAGVTKASLGLPIGSMLLRRIEAGEGIKDRHLRLKCIEELGLDISFVYVKKEK